MAWTSPKTDWATGELVAASDMNAIGENLAALKSPATVAYKSTTGSSARGSFTEIDGANLSLTITTTGGDLLAHFDCSGRANHNEHIVRAYFDIEIDGVRQGDNEGIAIATFPTRHDYANVSFTRLIQNLSAGVHTVKVLWRRVSHKNFASGRIEVSAFWVREI